MLPKKVREAAERADRFYTDDAGNTAPPAAPVADVAPVIDLPNEPVVPDVVDQTPPATPPVPPTPPAVNWEEKYRVLNGKYQAEVPRMAQEIRELKASMQTLQETAANPPAPPQAPAIDVKGMTPAEVVEQFGEDFAKAVGAIAAQIAGEHTSKVREEFKPQMDRVEQSAAESARESYMRELARLVPNWQEIDTDDNFTAFLDERDELSGRTRRTYFQEADKAMNAARVAKFFTAFKGNSAPAQPPAEPQAPSAIDVMVQPSAVRASPPPQGRRIWTQADVAKFYGDVRRGAYKPADVARIESDLFAAQRENRMRA